MEKIRLHTYIQKNSRLRGPYTMREIAENIEKYGVKINDHITYSRLAWVHSHDDIQLNQWPQKELPDISKIFVVEETDSYLIVYKPSGVPVHHGAGYISNTLVDWLVEHYPEQKKMQQDAEASSNLYVSAGIVHRLDKETSGILLVARDKKSHKAFQEEFRNRRVKKKYLAVLNGVLTSAQEIRGWQTRDLKQPRVQKWFEKELDAKRYHPESRFSHSLFEPLQVKNGKTLVEVTIFTGRMHQIRLQAAKALRMPVFGDILYGSKAQHDSHDFSKIFKDSGLALLSNEIELHTSEVSIHCTYITKVHKKIKS